MAEAATTLSVAIIIDWSTITTLAIAIVICVVEEPVDAAACVVADRYVTNYSNSNDAVSPDEGQPKEEVAEFRA